jgi:TM2 domain-containing membrane protein YozV
MAGTGIAPPPQAVPGPQLPPTPNAQPYYLPVSQPKTRVAFVLLGIFLGVFGVHNFYAGYIKKGTIQLCLTLLTCFYGAAISLVWAIIEICTVNQDADGTQFV